MAAFKGKYNRRRVFRGKLPFVVGADGVPLVYPDKKDAFESDTIDQKVQERMDEILEDQLDTTSEAD